MMGMAYELLFSFPEACSGLQCPITLPLSVTSPGPESLLEVL
jgi:hypothetical protein